MEKSLRAGKRQTYLLFKKQDKGKREKLGNYWPVRLFSNPGEVTEQILETISSHMKDMEAISQEQSALTGQGKVMFDKHDNILQWDDWLDS